MYLEEDLYGTFGGFNRYIYADGSPIRLYDPMGLYTLDDVERALGYTATVFAVAGIGVAATVGASPLLGTIGVAEIVDRDRSGTRRN